MARETNSRKTLIQTADGIKREREKKKEKERDQTERARDRDIYI